MPRWVVERKGGRRIDVFATARLLEYEDGSRFKITSVHDITESKKYEHIANVTQEKGHIGGWGAGPAYAIADLHGGNGRDISGESGRRALSEGNVRGLQ